MGKYREIAWTCEFKGEKSKRDQFPVSASILYMCPVLVFAKSILLLHRD